MKPAPLPSESKIGRFLQQKPLTTGMVMLGAVAIVSISGIIFVNRPFSGNSITDNSKPSLTNQIPELTAKEGEFVKVDLPLGWDLKEFKDGKGNNLTITGFNDSNFKYTGVTEIDITNATGQTVFSIKALFGIGARPCGILYKYSDTEQSYLNTQKTTEVDGSQTQVIDRSGKGDPEFNILGNRYRRVDTTLVQAEGNSTKFNPLCTNTGWISGFKDLGFRLESVGGNASSYPRATTYAMTIDPKISVGDLKILDYVLATLKPIEKPEAPPTTLATFSAPGFRNFSFQYDPSWKVEVKHMGDENSLSFLSDYSLECDKDNCAGVRLTKDSARVDMVFNVAVDDFGSVCRNDENHWVKLNNKWTRFDSSYPFTNLEKDTDEFDFAYSASSRFNAVVKNKEPDPNGYYFPSEENVESSESTQTLLICDLPGVFFSFEEVQPTIGTALRASKPRLYFSGEVNQTLLKEVDEMIKTINYPKQLFH